MTGVARDGARCGERPHRRRPQRRRSHHLCRAPGRYRRAGWSSTRDVLPPRSAPLPGVWAGTSVCWTAASSQQSLIRCRCMYPASSACPTGTRRRKTPRWGPLSCPFPRRRRARGRGAQALLGRSGRRGGERARPWSPRPGWRRSLVSPTSSGGGHPPGPRRPVPQPAPRAVPGLSGGRSCAATTHVPGDNRCLAPAAGNGATRMLAAADRLEHSRQLGAQQRSWFLLLDDPQRLLVQRVGDVRATVRPMSPRRARRWRSRRPGGYR